ncbi:hypothetical protein C8R45DRAFT_928601 [Mycena sanguinolenta]|nr:hypothetical protein C8R45DRAFT_928601 [Mycena sanguinolenta]
MSAPSTFPPLDSTPGAAEIGGFASTFLFGIKTLQVYHYFNKYQDDSLFLKSLVCITPRVAIADTQSFPGSLNFSTWHVSSPLPRHDDFLPHMHLSLGAGKLIWLPSHIPSSDDVPGLFRQRFRLFSGKWLIPVICWTMTVLRAITTSGMMGIEWGTQTSRLSRFNSDG